MIHVAEPSTASPRQPPENVEVYDPAEYFATPQISVPWDSGYCPEGDLKMVTKVHAVVERMRERVDDVFFLGGYPVSEEMPEWVMAQELGAGQSQEQRAALEKQLITECRVLLSSGSDPAEEYRFEHVVRTRDLAAARLDTVRMAADVNG